MVRNIGSSDRSHHPQNVSHPHGKKSAANVPPALSNIAQKISSVAQGNITAVGQHTFTKRPANPSEAKDINRIAAKVLTALARTLKRK